LTNQYENLRQSVINKAQRRDSGLGLALFLRAGMRVWMQTCGQLSQPSHTTVPIPNTREQQLDLRRSRDLINILVTMVLNQRKEQER
jgi:hypothetical protein